MFYVLRLVYAGQEAPVFQTRFPFYAETGLACRSLIRSGGLLVDFGLHTAGTNNAIS